METKFKINIEIPGDKRKGKCWAKVVRSIDYNQKGGYMFIGDFLEAGETLLEEGDVILYVGFEGTWKKGQQLAGIKQIVDGKEAVIVEQDLAWKGNKVSLAEKCEELLGKKVKDYEINTDTNPN